MVKKVTPAGIAGFCHVIQPDTKFNPEGDYKVELLLDPAAESTSKFIEFLDGMMEKAEQDAQAWAEEQRERKGLKRAKAVKRGMEPYEEVEHPQHGDVIRIRLSSKASGVNAKTGERWHREPPPQFDSAGNKLPKPVLFYGGSTIAVSGEFNTYVNPKGEFGITRRIRAIQILELVSGGGGAPKTAAEAGFEVNENGSFSVDDVAYPDDDVETGPDGVDGEAEDDETEF